MNEIEINTSQNVNIKFKTASIGERILAFIIDILIKGLYATVFFYFFGEMMYEFSRIVEEWVYITVILLLFSPIWFYSLICEMMFEGRTFGKMLLGLKVVKIDGYQASFGDYLTRWIFCIIDIYTNGGIVGVLSIIISKNNQRLGGMISGTAVISTKNTINISHTIFQNISTDYTPAFPQVIALSDNDIRIIKENFQKAIKVYDPAVIRKLSEKIESVTSIKRNTQEYTEQQFIRKVLQDYNNYQDRKSVV